MKKIITVLFVSLLLFSSCKFAEALNAKTGLKAPSDRNVITVFADFDSSNYCLIDLGDSFVWDKTALSLNKLLEYENFASWYASLTNGEWKSLGLYDPYTEKGLLSGDAEFTVSQKEAFYVGWNSPFERVRVLANNTTDKFFDYYLETDHAYDEEVELSYSTLNGASGFSQWISELGEYQLQGRYLYPSKFAEEEITASNYDSVQLSESVKITKWNCFVRLGWSTNRSFNSVIIYARNGTDDSYVVSLDGSTDEFYLTWSYLAQNKEFITWYKGLENGTKKIAGLGSSDSSIDIYAYNCSGFLYVSYSNNDVYIIWAENFQNPDWCDLSTYESEYISAGESVQLKYYSYGNSETDLHCYQTGIESVSFTSDNPAVAEVDSHGMVTGKSGGTANITVTMTSYSGVSVSTVRSIYVMENPEFEKRRIYNESYKYISSYDVSDDGKVFACNISSDLYVSTDAASSWSTTSISRGDGSYSPTNSIAVSSSGKTIVCPIKYSSGTGLFNGYYYYLYLSKDYGKTFKCIKELISGAVYNLCVSDDGNVVFYRNMNEGYYTTDGGENWSAFLSDISINSISISSSGRYVACGTSNGLYVSDDYGMNWDLVSDENSVSEIRMSSDGSKIVYVLNNIPRVYDINNNATEIITLPESQTYAYYFYASPDCTKYMVNSEKDTGVWYYYDGFSWTRLNQYISTSSLKMILSNNSVSFIDKNDYFYLWNTN